LRIGIYANIDHAEKIVKLDLGRPPSIKFHKKDYILKISLTLALPSQGGGNNYEGASASPPLVGGDRGEGESYQM
jgi:hypothetical protein